MLAPMTSDRILNDWIESFMEYTEDLVESPPIFRKWVAISTVASAMQRKCYLPFGIKTVYPNLYVVLVGDSGVRKGTAMEPGRQFLEAAKIHLSAEATTKEALIIRMKDIEKDPVFTGNTVHLDSSLTVHSAEFVVLIGHKDPEFLSYLCDWYDCHNIWKYETKNKGKYEINRVWINLLGGITPSLLQTSLPQEAIGGGFTSRILFIFSDEGDKIIPIPAMTEKEIKLQKQLEIDLATIKTQSGRFTLSPAFVDSYTDWAVEQKTSPPPQLQDPVFSGYNNRRRWHLLKLCMIVHASKSGSTNLELEDFEAALSLLIEAEINMPRTFSGVGRLEDGDIVSDILSSLALRGTTTMKELLRRYHKDVTEARLTEIVGTICKMGYAREVRQGPQQWIEYIEQQ